MSETQARATKIIEDLRTGNELVFDRFELKVVDGPDNGLSRTYGQEVVQIGTAQINDLVLADKTVSRFHIKIENKNNQFILTDVDSTNGTFIGRQRIRSVYLEDTTQIEVGGTKLRFKLLGDKTTFSLPERDFMGAIIGRSSQMRQLYVQLERIAKSEMPVIIEGETGTGKDLVAQVIHDHSDRKEEAFEVLDCAAIPDTLIESELFGHVKGAFTGADRDRPGIFERAHKGTVFLDEMGELKLEMQPKLLRVLETGQVRRVGGDTPIAVDVRVVAATHRSLRDMVNQAKFREDLFYRLAVCQIYMPALRERREDIPLLIEHFIKRFQAASKQAQPAEMDAATLEEFCNNMWPGNVRQLRNAVERYAVMGTSDFNVRPQREFQTPNSAATPMEFNNTNYQNMPLKEAKEAFEKQYLDALIKRHHGNIQESAQIAELHPKSLARLLRRYTIGRS